MRPLFSVIVPVYNTEKYISRCLDSIIAQTEGDFEVLVVNDGSKDNSENIIRHYESLDKRILQVIKPNGGLASARNCGIKHSRGKYLCFIDSDDFVDKDFLENFRGPITKFGDLDLIYSGIRYLPSGRELKVSLPVGRLLDGKSMIEESPAIGENKIIPFTVRYCLSAEFLQRTDLKFNEHIKYAEDSPFNLMAILSAKRMIAIKEISYNYVHNPSSITSTFKPTMIEDLDYCYQIKKLFGSSDENILFDYEWDIVNTHFNQWIPSIVDNFRKSPKGLKLRHTKKLVDSNFVQDGAKFILDNNLYTRKIQKMYLKAIKHRSYYLLHVLLRCFQLKGLIGIKRHSFSK